MSLTVTGVLDRLPLENGEAQDQESREIASWIVERRLNCLCVVCRVFVIL